MRAFQEKFSRQMEKMRESHKSLQTSFADLKEHCISPQKDSRRAVVKETGEGAEETGGGAKETGGGAGKTGARAGAKEVETGEGAGAMEGESGEGNTVSHSHHDTPATWRCVCVVSACACANC